MADLVKAALVGGGGYAAQNVVPFIRTFKNVVYTTVCDMNRATAEAAAAQIGAERVFTDLRDVLARPDIEMVELQTPNYLHAEQAIAALEAGKHVLVQKPMARTCQEAKAMILAARKANRLLGVYMDGYNDPWHWDIKAAIAAGLLGRIVGFRLRYAHQGGLALKGEAWRKSMERVGGGCFLLLTVHLINAVQWFLDSRFIRVTGFMKTLMAPMEGDDSTAGALELDNGLIGAAEASYVAAGSDDIPNTVLELRGTDGAIRHQRDDGILYVYSKDKIFKGKGFVYDRPGQTMRYTRDVHDYQHPTVHERFAAAIRGGPPYVCSAEQGLQDLAVCLAMAESARTGRAVSIDEFIGEKP